jgi:hypothetical protein
MRTRRSSSASATLSSPSSRGDRRTLRCRRPAEGRGLLLFAPAAGEGAKREELRGGGMQRGRRADMRLGYCRRGPVASSFVAIATALTRRVRAPPQRSDRGETGRPPNAALTHRGGATGERQGGLPARGPHPPPDGVSPCGFSWWSVAQRHDTLPPVV